MRTCTVMTYTDGEICRFEVMRGRYHRGDFDVSSAQIIAGYRYAIGNDGMDGAHFLALYSILASMHATPDAPAVPWQTRG